MAKAKRRVLVLAWSKVDVRNLRALAKAKLSQPQAAKKLRRARYRDVATDPRGLCLEVREASQSRAFDSPSPGECMEARTARPDEEQQKAMKLKIRFRSNRRRAR
jgi:hypothetical protein